MPGRSALTLPAVTGSAYGDPEPYIVQELPQASNFTLAPGQPVKFDGGFIRAYVAATAELYGFVAPGVTVVSGAGEHPLVRVISMVPRGRAFYANLTDTGKADHTWDGTEVGTEVELVLGGFDTHVEPVGIVGGFLIVAGVADQIPADLAFADLSRPVVRPNYSAVEIGDINPRILVVPLESTLQTA